jgi:DNA-directed RNA polymerase subunit delta
MKRRLLRSVDFLEIKVFEGQKRDELSMIEVAHAILEQHGEVLDLSDLVNAIQNYLGKSDAEIRDNLSQFYTDLNIDGSFISLGENRWGLRSWYAIDEIDEEVTHVEEVDEDEDGAPRKKKKKRINAFATTPDDDVIDYNDDDPEDEDFDAGDDDIAYDDDDDDDDDEEIVAYDHDLKEIVVDPDEEEADEIDEEDDEFVTDDDDDDDFEEDKK